MNGKSHTHLFPTYARAKVSFAAGDGAWLESTTGERYLDFATGVAVNALGHSHPRLNDVLQNQSRRLWHTSNIYEVPEQEALAKRLCELSFADNVFFCNSGTEAVELAIKSARRFHFRNGSPGRRDIITTEGAFHGRTAGALAATGREQYLEGFEPRQQGFVQVRWGDLGAIESAITPNTAGILLEPVQGEGGLRTMPDGFLRAVRALCDEHGILLLLDEVQTGIGRTGRFFGYEFEEVTPDIMALAKGLGCGFPVGACLATSAVAQAMVPGTHGSTFGGNPLAMAVASEVVEIISTDDFLARVRDASRRLHSGLSALVRVFPGVFKEVRGKGLLVGIQCTPPVREVVGALLDAKLLSVPAAENTVRFLPPLNVTDDEIDEALQRIVVTANTLSKHISRLD